ncbi:MAG: DUF3375 domain-containing protein [Bacteroidia bacterium]|jgi:hypothetical protein|nr:DUF3375 domain-containing protein [Bacteroidia bacterium]
MTYDAIVNLLKGNTTVKLITADNAPLIISFIYKAFKKDNRNTLPENEIIALLDDHLYQINHPEKLYPKQAKSYLTDWTQDGTGFLRKYYDTGDVPLYELTPATETALKWIEELNKPEFIGTESRLKLLIDILKELSSKTKQDIETRIKELETQKQRIELDISNARLGLIDILDETQIKERYLNAEETAKRLLSDFRQVEQNFRDIDKDFRKKIITTTQTKGKVLEELFQQQDYLLQTDQGRSFKAFWEFLMSQAKQEELETLLHEVLSLPEIRKMQGSSFTIDRIKNNLIEAGDKVNRSTGSLLEQLRKYVEHKSFLENKRIHDNITHILKIISENPEMLNKDDALLEIDNTIRLDLIMERPLHTPPQKIKFKKTILEEGQTTSENQQLYDQFNIDISLLRNNIKEALKQHSQITLKQLINEYEIKKGVAEVIAYVEIASKDGKHIYNDEFEEEIIVENTKTNKSFKLKIPQIIYCR